MKDNLKALVSGVLIGSLLTGGAAVAKTGSELIEAWYSNIKIVLNGSEIAPKDANGRVVEPFTSNGTTYLPVRAISEALGKEVRWDGETHTVYIEDGKKPTETPEPVEATPTPKPTSTPQPTPQEEIQEPSQHSFTTTRLLQISGYREKDIKGEISLSWDSDRPNARFTATMRCNNGGLADYVDCEIALVKTLSTTEKEITGNFRVTHNDTVKYDSIQGTLTVTGDRLTLHTQGYDYHLVASLDNGSPSTREKEATFMSFQTVKMDLVPCHGMIGLEFSKEAATFTGSFTQEDKKYTVSLVELSEMTANKLSGTFTVTCDGTPLVTNGKGVLEDLSAGLGDTLTLSVDGLSPLYLRLVEIGY